MTNEYRIVDIPNEYSVVVNAGTKDGIERGDKMEIFVSGKPIVDPVTGETLGTLDSIKAVLDVVDVYPNMCLCKNNEKDGSALTSVMASINQSMYGHRKPLSVEKTEISFSLSTNNTAIKIGDLVRKTT